MSEAFASDIVINGFRHNSHEEGTVEVTIGNLANINFERPFSDAPEIALTLKQFMNAVSGYTTPDGFAIFTSASDVFLPIGTKSQIMWQASGNRTSDPIPLWRILLSNAKEHQKSKNYRSEIVELESAFEIFFSDYLYKNLGARLRQETIDWLLKKQSIEGQMAVGYRELTGNNIAKQYPLQHSKWQNSVKEIRDRIVHQGITITSEQAVEARKATFNFLTTIDKSTMEQFQIQMNDIGTAGPHYSFGMHTVEDGQIIQHGLIR